ncbi:hypothetical protein EVAR_44648_1 [Eumeta japonica]|uniref:Uncharacterized protein n=1 Tax=Eumeta variegata TaxID=151549 RepID=A0A4C1XGL8_EUMVA|nr:hypothetical protein EVAR_44648_1 [Eumeta japonica]
MCWRFVLYRQIKIFFSVLRGKLQDVVKRKNYAGDEADLLRFLSSLRETYKDILSFMDIIDTRHNLMILVAQHFLLTVNLIGSMALMVSSWLFADACGIELESITNCLYRLRCKIKAAFVLDSYKSVNGIAIVPIFVRRIAETRTKIENGTKVATEWRIGILNNHVTGIKIKNRTETRIESENDIGMDSQGLSSKASNMEI